MKFVKWLCTHPFIIGLIVLACVAFFTPATDMDFIRDTVGGGLIVKIITAFVACLTLMASLLLYTKMRVFVIHALNMDFKNDPYFLIFLGLMALGFAQIISRIFG